MASYIKNVATYIPKELLSSKEERQRIAKKIKKKSKWAYNELKALIDYCKRYDLDPVSINGSVFGAIGLCQFMPSNILRFGVDADRDGRIDLFTKSDALASMANYLKSYGWREGLTPKEQEAVILRYNYSRPYARTVLTVAQRLREMEHNEKNRSSSL